MNDGGMPLDFNRWDNRMNANYKARRPKMFIIMFNFGVGFCFFFFWFGALFDNILPLSVEISQRAWNEIEKNKIRLWDHVRRPLAWAEETREKLI